MDFSQVMWGSKKFSDLLKNVFDNSRDKEKQITSLIDVLKPLIVDTQSALMTVPLVAEYLNIGVKNDEQLIKLAAIVQRCLGGSGSGDSDIILTEADKEQLFKEVKSVGENIKEPKPIEKT